MIAQIRIRFVFPTLALCFLPTSLHAQKETTVELAPADPSPEVAPDHPSTLAEALFGSHNQLDSSYDDFQDFKKRNHLPITFGAHNWFHVDRDRRIIGNGFGPPDQRGSYYYFLGFDPVLQLEDEGFVNEVGLRIQGRIRDSGDRLREFYDSSAWLYESFAFAKTDFGTFKAGKIVTDFGIAWDNSWWEGVPAFDGFKFDPDWGIGWENTWKISDSLSIATNAQFFFIDDNVSVALVNADAESSEGVGERNTGVIRVVPTWQLSENTTLAWGVSALAGEIKDGSENGIDDNRVAIGTDLKLTVGGFSVFGEYIDNFGAVSPTRYVSGGASDRQTSARVGMNYQWGWIGAHVNYSYGRDHNPDGEQYLFAPGFTFQLAKSLTLYTEYVRWDVEDQNGTRTRFDDGFEFILVWNL